MINNWIDVRLTIDDIDLEEVVQLKYRLHMIGEIYSYLIPRPISLPRILVEYDTMSSGSFEQVKVIDPKQKSSFIVAKISVNLQEILSLKARELCTSVSSSVRDVLADVFKKRQIDVGCLSDAFNKAVKSEFLLNRMIAEVGQRGRGITARVISMMSPVGNQISVEFHHDFSVNSRVEVINLWPNSYFEGEFISHFKWNSINQFLILNKSKEIIFHVNLDLGSSRVEFKANHSSATALEKHLEMAKYRSRAEVKRLFL